MIGYSRCSYVNEHLVAPAGPAVEPGLRLEQRVARAQIQRGVELEGPWTVCRCSNYIFPHCRFYNNTPRECQVNVRLGV